MVCNGGKIRIASLILVFLVINSNLVLGSVNGGTNCAGDYFIFVCI